MPKKKQTFKYPKIEDSSSEKKSIKKKKSSSKSKEKKYVNKSNKSDLFKRMVPIANSTTKTTMSNIKRLIIFERFVLNWSCFLTFVFFILHLLFIRIIDLTIPLVNQCMEPLLQPCQ